MGGNQAFVLIACMCRPFLGLPQPLDGRNTGLGISIFCAVQFAMSTNEDRNQSYPCHNRQHSTYQEAVYFACRKLTVGFCGQLSVLMQCMLPQSWSGFCKENCNYDVFVVVAGLLGSKVFGSACAVAVMMVMMICMFCYAGIASFGCS